MSYYVSIYNGNVFVSNEEKCSLRVTVEVKRFGKTLHRFYVNEVCILEVTWTGIFFDDKLKITENNLDFDVEYESNIFKSRLKFKGDYYQTKKRCFFNSFFKKPAFSIFKNGLKTGEAFMLILLPSNSNMKPVYRIEFSDGEPVLPQLISFVMELAQAMKM